MRSNLRVVPGSGEPFVIIEGMKDQREIQLCNAAKKIVKTLFGYASYFDDILSSGVYCLGILMRV